MKIGMLVAGIGCLLAGLVAIGFGIPINEFGLGNTLILAGAVTACSGLLILSLWVVVRELKGIAERLGDVPATGMRDGAPPPAGAEVGDPVLGAEVTGGEPSGAPPPPWAEETVARDRPRQEASSQPAPEPPVKSRRSLMFSSSSRRERERTQARTGDVPVAEPRPAGPGAETDEVPPPNFDDAWPKSERARPADAPPRRRFARSPPTAAETAPGHQPPAVEDQPPVTVLKSGVVDGMAYSLYSDGSIEAQMPEGMMRFASIDELRAHLDQRP
jgi:hypothetical protein